MRLALDVLTGFIALQHALFLVLESFLWTTPFGRKVFKRTAAEAESSKVLAQNQGLYNGFLSAGLVWALVVREAPHGPSVRLFFLGCVAVAGVVGGLTAARSILFIQGVPAFLAIALFFAS
jgi:putative membrane protein